MSAAIVAAGISAGASSAAASKQASAIKHAADLQYQQFLETKKALNEANKEAQGYIAPYAGVGQSALNELAYGMGLATPEAGYKSKYTPKGGLTDFNYGQDQYQKDVGYTPMVNSLAELQATPGYQFQLEQGLQGVNNSAAAKGGLLSGANMKAINDYSQGQAATGYQNAWDRAQSAYQNAFNRNLTAKQQKFSNLQSMTNNGQNAAGNQGNWAMQTGTSLANASTNYGNNMGSLSLAQGQNQANNINQIGNAIGGGLSRIAGMFGGGGGGGAASNIPSAYAGGSPSSQVSWNYDPSLNNRVLGN